LVFRLTAGEVDLLFCRQKSNKKAPESANLMLGDSGLRGPPGIGSLTGYSGYAFYCAVEAEISY